MSLKNCLQVAFVLSVLYALTACSTVPITGRRQLSLVPQATLIQTSFDQYDTLVGETGLSDDYRGQLLVEKVGKRIQVAVEAYLAGVGQSALLNGYDWEFNLLKGDQVNAFAMPGGKVAVYDGLLPVTKTEEGLAVVIGHEIAHIIAGHGGERMSQAISAQLGLALTSILLQKSEAEYKQLYAAGAAVGAQFLMLSYSRDQENEADKLGLIFMALAGYDPEAAVPFWERMQATSSGGSPPEFLSTHPSHSTRIQNIHRWIPQAQSYAQP